MTWESLAERPVPPWYSDAKLGILLCWGPFSVPAWAPPVGDPVRLAADQGWDYLFSHDPRAEWYANGIEIAGSPTQRHHRSAWGRMTRYDSFIRTFRQGLRDWDPAALVATLLDSGARYVVATAKHHDGFTSWPARRRNPRRRGWQSTHDIVGSLAEATRAAGLRFGVYYSTGMDWTFGGTPIRNLPDILGAIPRTRTYAAYVDAHWRELISRYSPSILWSDVGCPASQDVLGLLSDYYEAIPDGLVNDRFGQPDAEDGSGLLGMVAAALRRIPPFRGRHHAHARGMHPARHADFHTVDGEAIPALDDGRPWECVRSLGCSGGFSSEEKEDQTLPVAALVRLLCDVASRGGNLMLTVGPRADGTIAPLHAQRLRGLGEWLKLNGEAIFGSRPWMDAPVTATEDDIEIRYTMRGMTTYAILMGTPAGRTIVLPSLRLLPYAGVRVLGSLGFASWYQEGKDIHIRLSEPLRESPAHVVTITPNPRL
ncbi:MAG TPA: alpha-L-fucosidase [Spirochaetia bacterium]|nr:alpha-L-fucosidase [Spirochaetia bacterium]